VRIFRSERCTANGPPWSWPQRPYDLLLVRTWDMAPGPLALGLGLGRAGRGTRPDGYESCMWTPAGAARMHRPPLYSTFVFGLNLPLWLSRRMDHRTLITRTHILLLLLPHLLSVCVRVPSRLAFLTSTWLGHTATGASGLCCAYLDVWDSDLF
jgi:hypothetical protein